MSATTVHAPWCTAHHEADSPGDNDWCETAREQIGGLEVYALNDPSDGPHIVCTGDADLRADQAGELAQILLRMSNRLASSEVAAALDAGDVHGAARAFLDSL